MLLLLGDCISMIALSLKLHWWIDNCKYQSWKNKKIYWESFGKAILVTVSLFTIYFKEQGCVQIANLSKIDLYFRWSIGIISNCTAYPNIMPLW